MKPDMMTLLKLITQKGASDLHITVGTAPQLRIDEKLFPAPFDLVTPEMAKELAFRQLISRL